MPSKDSRAVEYAKALRGWAAEHPVADIGLGFVPGVGQLYGLAHAAAANLDPDATALDRGLATAGILPMGRLGTVAKKVVIGERGANAAERKLLETARELFKKGKGPEEIENATGWWNKYGEWKRELPDDQMKVKPAYDFGIAPESTLETKITNVVSDHPALDRYSEFPHLRFEYGPAGSGSGGSYTEAVFPKMGQTGKMRVGREANPRQVTAHEMQHPIQEFEGWKYRGTNTRGKRYVEYLNDPGEIEARITELRRHWTEAERKKLPFRKMVEFEEQRLFPYTQDVLGQMGIPSYDIPKNDLAELLRKHGLDPDVLETRDLLKD